MTAAAAAALGAEAQRLLKALDLAMERHHPECRLKQQRRHKGMHMHNPAAAAAAAGDGLGFEGDFGCGAVAEDEPICGPGEYLRL